MTTDVPLVSRESQAMPDEPTADYDVARIRADFPVLDQEVHGRRLVYLDNAATAQKPRTVIEAESRFYSEDNSNVHRGVHALSERATAAYEGAREDVRSFIGAGSTEEVVFVRGTTEAINLVAQSFVRPRVGPGDEILITHMEHHSNIVPWQLVREQTGCTLRVVPITDDGALDMDAFDSMLEGATKFVSVVHVSNALGTVNPVADIVRQAHAKNIPVLVDGAQAVPHRAVDVAALDCDFYTVSGHKAYGPTGIGVLYGKREHLEAMPPYQGGGDMIRSVDFDETTFNDLPFKFEAGTPNIAGAIGFGAAVRYLRGLGMDRVAAHEQRMLAYATERLGEIPGVRVIGTPPEKAGVVSFTLDGVHPHDIGTLLDRHGVAIRTGHHCAQPVMKRFGVPATARISFGVYTTTEDIDAFIEGVRKVVEVFA